DPDGPALLRFLFHRRTPAPRSRIIVQPRRTLLLLYSRAGGRDAAVVDDGAVPDVAAPAGKSRAPVLHRGGPHHDRRVLVRERQAHSLHPACHSSSVNPDRG